MLLRLKPTTFAFRFGLGSRYRLPPVAAAFGSGGVGSGCPAFVGRRRRWRRCRSRLLPFYREKLLHVLLRLYLHSLRSAFYGAGRVYTSTIQFLPIVARACLDVPTLVKLPLTCLPLPVQIYVGGGFPLRVRFPTSLLPDDMPAFGLYLPVDWCLTRWLRTTPSSACYSHTLLEFCPAFPCLPLICSAVLRTLPVLYLILLRYLHTGIRFHTAVPATWTNLPLLLATYRLACITWPSDSSCQLFTRSAYTGWLFIRLPADEIPGFFWTTFATFAWLPCPIVIRALGSYTIPVTA